MSTYVSIILSPDDPQPTVRMEGRIPVIRFDDRVLIQLGTDAAPYLRELAASMLHLASLAERADAAVSA